MQQQSKWEFVKKCMDILQFGIVVFGVVFTLIQINDIKDNQINRKNDLEIRYYDRLNSGTNRNISIAIQHKKDLLKPKGKFTTDQLDDYLGNFHDVGQALNSNLLDEDMVCSDFSDLISKAHSNAELMSYISKVRTEEKDNTYFGYFDYLYDFVLDCQE